MASLTMEDRSQNTGQSATSCRAAVCTGTGLV